MHRGGSDQRFLREAWIGLDILHCIGGVLYRPLVRRTDVFADAAAV